MNCIEWCKEVYPLPPLASGGLLWWLCALLPGFILALRWMPARGLIFRLLRTVGIIDRKNKEDRFFDQA